MKIFILTIFCAIFLSGFAQIPTIGLVAYFPFNGNAKDSSSHKAHATTHSVTLTTDRFGSTNSAYLFSGSTSSYMDFPTTYVLNNTYTYSLWAKINTIPASGNMAFALNIGGSGGDQSLNIGNNFSGTYNGWLGGGYNTVTPHFPLNENKSLSTSSWTHIVCVRDSSFALLYVNGVLVDSLGSGSKKIPSYGSGTKKAMIGIRNDATGPFNGKIDDVCIYNRALSKPEIDLLYLDIPIMSIQPVVANTSGFLLYPNPNHSSLIHIQLNHPQAGNNNVKVMITNALGQTVYNEDLANTGDVLEIRNDLKAGLHVISIFDHDNVLMGREILLIQ